MDNILRNDNGVELGVHEQAKASICQVIFEVAEKLGYCSNFNVNPCDSNPCVLILVSSKVSSVVNGCNGRNQSYTGERNVRAEEREQQEM
jgi:hypothetical protein